MSMESTASASASAAPPRERIVCRFRLPPPWTPEEDARLERLTKEHRFGHWHRVAKKMPGRSSTQCRYRWREHLARDVYHRPFTARDDTELARLHQRFGGRWHDISRAVYGRTSRVMKRRWREIRKTRAFYGPPAVSSDDIEMKTESESESESESCRSSPPLQHPNTDVLAAGVSSCGLLDGHPMDPRAGSLALGFACMAV